MTKLEVILTVTNAVTLLAALFAVLTLRAANRQQREHYDDLFANSRRDFDAQSKAARADHTAVLSSLQTNHQTAFSSLRASYHAVLVGLRDDNKDLRDRWFMSKGMPPSGVAVTEQYEKREAEREQKREEKVPHRGGPLRDARVALAEEELKRNGKETV